MPTKITEIESQNDKFNLESRTSDYHGRQSDSADAVTRSAKEPTLFKVEGALYVKDRLGLKKSNI
jgi:hypothetical protein